MTIIHLLYATCLDCGTSFTYNSLLSFRSEPDLDGVNTERKCTECGSENTTPTQHSDDGVLE